MTLQTSPFRLTLFDHLNASVLNKTISLRNSVLEWWCYKLLQRICPKTIVVPWYFLLALFLLFSFKTNYLAAFVCFSLSHTEMQPHLVPLYLSVSAAFVGKTTGVHSHLPQNTCYVTLCPGERSDSPESFLLGWSWTNFIFEQWTTAGKTVSFSSVSDTISLQFASPSHYLSRSDCFLMCGLGS